VKLSIRTVLADAFGVLLFRQPSPAIATHWPVYLVLGLFFTGLAGVGRYWDNPRAEPWQQFGLGSLGYVVCLALFLWLIVLPLKPERWSYRNVLVFLTLTAPPALLYAIPVEQFMSLSAARSVNAWFLGVVALWRVALLIWFLRVIANLGDAATLVATFLPLVLIVVALTTLNLEHVVFEFMSGMRNQSSGNDTAFAVVWALSLLAVVTSPFLIVAYVWLVFKTWRAS